MCGNSLFHFINSHIAVWNRDDSCLNCELRRKKFCPPAYCQDASHVPLKHVYISRFLSLSLSFVRKLIDIEFVETWFGPTVWLHTLHASTLVLLGCASLCRWDGCFWADAVHHNDITAVTNLLSSRVSSQLSEGFVVFACPNSFRSDVPFHVVRKCILESALKCGKKQRRGIERMEARLRNEVSKMNRM